MKGNSKASNYNNNNNNSIDKNIQNYNIIACESYFKTKPSPSEDEITLFVEELKVPLDVVQKYLADRTVPQKESLLEDGAKAKKGSSQPYKVVSRPLGLIPKQGIKEEPDQSQHGKSQPDQYQPDQYQPDQSQPDQSQQDPSFLNVEGQTSQVVDQEPVRKIKEEQANQNEPSTSNLGEEAESLQGDEEAMEVQPTPSEEEEPRLSSFPSQPPTSSQSENLKQDLQQLAKSSSDQSEEQKHQTRPNQTLVAKKATVINQTLRIGRRPIVERVRRELMVIFGANKIFCTLDDLKPLADGDVSALKRISEDLTRQGKVQLICLFCDQLDDPHYHLQINIPIPRCKWSVSSFAATWSTVPPMGVPTYLRILFAINPPLNKPLLGHLNNMFLPQPHLDNLTCLLFLEMLCLLVSLLPTII